MPRTPEGKAADRRTKSGRQTQSSWMTEKVKKWERYMEQKWNFEVGDVVKLKKPHPCGSHEWEILRVGADFRLKCMGCGHQVMTERKMVEKNARGLTKAAEKQQG